MNCRNSISQELIKLIQLLKTLNLKQKSDVIRHIRYLQESHDMEEKKK